jgi:hypothetical protein
MARSSVYASNAKRLVAKNRRIRTSDPLTDRDDQPWRVSGPESLLRLQRLAGNAAVTELIHPQTLPVVGTGFRTSGTVTGGLVQRCPGCGGTCSRSNHEDKLQGAVVLEREADEDDEWGSGGDGGGSGRGSEWIGGGGTTAVASVGSDDSGVGSQWSAGPSADGSSAGSEWTAGPGADESSAGSQWSAAPGAHQRTGTDDWLDKWMEDPIGQLEQLGQGDGDDAGSPSMVASEKSESIHPEEQDAEDASKNPDLECDEIIRHIRNLIRRLIDRFTDLESHGGRDAGHRKRILILQKLLKGFMSQAKGACKNGEYSPDLEQEANDWAQNELPRIELEPGESPTHEPSIKDKIAAALEAAGVPAWAEATLIALIIADLADPEPFSKVAGAIGVAAAVIFFIAIGRKSDVPSTAQA